MNWLQEHIAAHPFTIIGHRGAAGLAPENTLASFQLAAELGCPMIELDVHVAGQGQDPTLMVIHDFTLDRTTNGKGRIDATPSAVLATYCTTNGEAIPTLERIFSWAGSTRIQINVELKGQGTGAAVARFIKMKQNPTPESQTPVVVSSFDRRELRSFRAEDTSTPVALLYDKWHSKWLDHADEFAASAINLGSKIATAKRIARIRAAGYAVFVYTVNTLQRAERLRQYGANGVFTDRPDRMQKLMN